MKKFKIIFVFILLLALSGGVYYLFFASYSSGYRVGTIIKMSNRGVVFKTHEGQLHTRGVTAGAEGELASTTWDFSVKRENEVVLNSISKAADEQKRVKLFYDEKFHQWSFFGDTKYFVTEVEILKPNKDSEPKPEIKEELDPDDYQPNNENTMF